MTTLPDDLQDVLNQIDAADSSGDAIVEGLGDTQFHWQPDQGRAWSIAQCLEHLGNMNAFYGAAMRSAVDHARSHGWRRAGPIASSRAGRWFIASQEPPVKRKVRSPSQVIPQSTKSRAEVMAHYHDSHARIRQLIHDCADIDVNRATFKNPFLSVIKVRVGTALRIIAAHDRRHLWQAEQVKGKAGFPTR
jgi:hypothetical protein